MPIKQPESFSTFIGVCSFDDVAPSPEGDPHDPEAHAISEIIIEKAMVACVRPEGAADHDDGLKVWLDENDLWKMHSVMNEIIAKAGDVIESIEMEMGEFDQLMGRTDLTKEEREDSPTPVEDQEEEEEDSVRESRQLSQRMTFESLPNDVRARVMRLVYMNDGGRLDKEIDRLEFEAYGEGVIEGARLALRDIL